MGNWCRRMKIEATESTGISSMPWRGDKLDSAWGLRSLTSRECVGDSAFLSGEYFLTCGILFLFL
ncbi:hypothetical protein ACRRTK_012997 [Alexandromys fortis]